MGSSLPSQEYSARLADRLRLKDSCARRERLVGNTRVALFLMLIVVGVLSIALKWLSAWWLLVPLLPSLVLLFVHEVVTRQWLRAGRAAQFYEAGLRRLNFTWQGKGQQGKRFIDDQHPYAADLDLFGHASLFELLCTARTSGGEETLAQWLLHPASPSDVRDRQAAVLELRPRLDLRERLALLAAEVPSGVDFAALAAWGAAPRLLRPAWLRWVALLLAILSLFTVIGWILMICGFPPESYPLGNLFETYGPWPFLLVLATHAFFVVAHQGRIDQVLKAVDRKSRDLGLLSHLLALLEKESFTSSRLQALNRELTSGASVRPSQQIAQLANLVEKLDSRRNQFFAPFAYITLWGTQLAYGIEGWRAQSGPAIAHWIRVVGEFEALSSLASHAYENPDDIMPEIVEAGPIYEAERLGHPLLPPATTVRNDLHLNRELRLWVVSGSNMSGKSTFLRTVGINAVLAQAGATVRAAKLSLSPLAIGATLRIQDSLAEGRSRFYAEVLRVRQVVELSRGQIPLLFLLDEIFAGTNSHDRRLGAEAIVLGLVKAGAIGLVTTHDLSLTEIVEKMGPQGCNIHFADEFANGVMTFDYRVQPGVVRHSNALALMRAVGLEV